MHVLLMDQVRRLKFQFKHMEETLILLENLIVPCYHAFTCNVTYGTVTRFPHSCILYDRSASRSLVIGVESYRPLLATGAVVYRERE
jgi:hypothetical protein